ncbi:MAG TPA: hypothetical protein VFC31_05015 [Candidatus Limnocylindria bacterium]|nr:hypothetical protein [Candidatus Limnocylindria bacterium]
MPRIAGRTAADVRGLVPEARAAWDEIERSVLRSGVVDQRVKELCFRYLAGEISEDDAARYEGRERAALEWTGAIAYDSDRADDDLWRRLHASFSEAELVDLGCAIGFELGRQHWRRSVGLPARGD